MASYTTNYGLHQWVPGDNFLRTDFNDDFLIIDNAIKAVADALSSGLAGLEADKAEFVTGNYVGNDDDQNINLGFRPQAVLVANDHYAAIANRNSSHSSLSLTSTGFSVEYLVSWGVNTANTGGEKYTYLAMR